MYNLVIRLVIIIFSVATAFVLYYKLVRPHILEPLCLVDTQTAIEIVYFTKNNTVLINIIPTGVWIWYNGKDSYIYDNPISGDCTDNKNYEMAYKIDKISGLPHSYNCITKLQKLIDSYKDREVNYMFLRDKNPKNFGATEVLNMFFNRKIIN